MNRPGAFRNDAPLANLILDLYCLPTITIVL